MEVGGYAIVMEGDPLRDPDLAKTGEDMIRNRLNRERANYQDAIIKSYGLDNGGLKVWTEDLIKYVAAKND